MRPFCLGLYTDPGREPRASPDIAHKLISTEPNVRIIWRFPLSLHMKFHLKIRMKSYAKWYEENPCEISYKTSYGIVWKFYSKYHGSFALVLKCGVIKVDKYFSSDLNLFTLRDAPLQFPATATHPSDSQAGWNSTQHPSWRVTESVESQQAS